MKERSRYWPIVLAIALGIPALALLAAVIWLVNVLLQPQPVTIVKPTSSDILNNIRRVNKQIFIEHDLVVDLDYSDTPEGWFKFLGNLGIKNDFVVLLHGRVAAGIDLQELTPDMIWVSPNGDQVMLTLPPPKVFDDNLNLDIERSRVISRRETCPNFLCQDKLTAFQKDIVPEGRARLKEAAIRNGILEQTASDAKAYYQLLLETLGFKRDKIRIEILAGGN